MSGSTVDPGDRRSRVAGAVLTGGASRRMGRDKALMPIDGTAMAVRVADVLLAAGCAPVVAIGGDGDGLAALGLDRLPDAWPGEGPLGGILTALKALTALTVLTDLASTPADVANGAAATSEAPTDVFVVATDLAFLDESTVRRVLDAAAAAPDAQVVMARTDRAEPLCALWRASSANALRSRFDAGERAVHRAIDELRVHTVDVDADAMRNLNQPSDIDDAGTARRRRSR